MVYFREVQPSAKNPVIWVVAAFTVFVVGRTLRMPEVQSAGTIGFAAVLPVLVLLWLLLMRLQTEVRDDGVHLRFRALWFPRTFSWDGIRSAEAVSYRPLRDFGGWGIRRGWGEWAWNVSGSKGVRLHFHDGKSFLIGSAQPDRLAAAIGERLATAERPV